MSSGFLRCPTRTGFERAPDFSGTMQRPLIWRSNPEPEGLSGPGSGTARWAVALPDGPVAKGRPGPSSVVCCFLQQKFPEKQIMPNWDATRTHKPVIPMLQILASPAGLPDGPLGMGCTAHLRCYKASLKSHALYLWQKRPVAGGYLAARDDKQFVNLWYTIISEL